MDQPTPDTANWTWVLERQCPDCQFNARDIELSELGGLLRANAASWRKVLGRGDVVLRRPPVVAGASPVWSALEYGCHVRDVYKKYQERFELMLKKSNPEFPDWDQDAAAIKDKYWEQDPDKVAYELAVAGGKLADLLDRVSGDEWDRTGRRSDGSNFTVASMALYLLHDPVHHLWDVEHGFEALLG